MMGIETDEGDKARIVPSVPTPLFPSIPSIPSSLFKCFPVAKALKDGRCEE
jgi:hypothetical protein